MRYELKTRGEEGTLTFRASNQSKYNYVYLIDPECPSSLGHQICEGGDFRGHCLTCGPTEESLQAVARKWWRQRRALLFRTL